jgi:hypothetical protein
MAALSKLPDYQSVQRLRALSLTSERQMQQAYKNNLNVFYIAYIPNIVKF